MYNRPSAPLVLDRLFVQGGNYRIEAEWPESSTPPSDPPPSSPLPSESGSVLPGVIAGCVVGAIVLVTVIFLAWFFVRRRREKTGSTSLIENLPLHPIATRPPSSNGNPVPMDMDHEDQPTPASMRPSDNGNLRHLEPSQSNPTAQQTVQEPPAGQATQQIREITSRGGVAVAARDIHQYHYHR